MWFVLFSAGLHGEQAIRLTLEECIRRALAVHPRVALAQSDLAIKESLLKQARAARFHPQVEINGLLGPVPAAKGSPYDPNLRSDFSDLGVFTRAEITSLQPVYTFGKLEGKADAARHAVEIGRHAQDESANEIRRETEKLYYGILLARELVSLADGALQTVEKARAKVREGIQSGAGQFTPIDQYRLDVFSLEIEARRVSVAASARSLLAALKAALGFPHSADFDIADTALEAPARNSVDLEAASRQALTRRPEIRQLRAGEEARAALVRSARADLYPQFFAGGLLRYGYAPNRTDQRNPFIRDDFNFFQGGFAVGFRYSLNFAGTRAKVQELEGEQQRLRAQRRIAETAIAIQARNSADGLEAAESVTDLRQKSARVARSWLAAAESNFNLGIGETRDLVDAFQAYLQTRIAQLQSLHDEQVARADLEYAKGGN
jgi:outer membrane protein TolC